MKSYNNGSLLLGERVCNGYQGVTKVFCEKCGLKDKRLLVIHHKKPVLRRTKKQHFDNSPNNLQVLCWNCHFKAHNYRWYRTYG